MDIETKVVKRDPTMTSGYFKKGTEVTLDTEHMIAYHGGLVWSVTAANPSKSLYKLSGFETYFEVIK